MKEGKKVLSIQVDAHIIDKLKDISAHEKRSQAKTIEILIEEKHKYLETGNTPMPAKIKPVGNETPKRINLAAELEKIKKEGK